MKLQTRRPIQLQHSDLRAAFKTFRPALRGQRRRVITGVVLALTATALELLKPWPITLVIDALVTQDSVAFEWIALFAAMAFVVPSVLGLVNEQLQLTVARVSRKATVRIRSDVFDHVQRLEINDHQKFYSGDLLVRLMGDVNMIRDLLFPSWLNVLSRSSVLLGGIVVFAIVDIRLLTAAMLPLPFLWLTVERGSAAIKKAAGKQRKKEGAIASRAAESLRNVALIKAFAAEERTTEEFRADARGAERASMAAARHAARMSRLTEMLTGAGVGLVLIVGARSVQAGQLTPGQLVLAMSYTKMIYKPIRKLTGEGVRVAKATACAIRVMSLLETPAEDSDNGIEVERLDGPVDFLGVSHRYHDGRRSVDRLSVRIPAGDLVAVTGENGAGKSTLLSLLLRLHRPHQGAIAIGGTPIEKMQLSSYRDQIAYVPQNLALFGGTIRENILFGRPDASDDDVLTAADLTLLTPVLAQLPDGLDTMLDENGSSLSGGQARRLMLARAAIRDASILLLDEPLAGLDQESSQTVARAISNIAAGRTTLVVHHGDLSEIQPDRYIHLEPRESVELNPVDHDLIDLGSR